MKFVYNALFYFVLLMLSACDSSSNVSTDSDKTKSMLSGKTMGTSYNIVIAHSKETIVETESLKKNIDDLLYVLNQQVSTYVPSSQISLFNKNDELEWVKVDHDFYSVVEAAQNISKLSQGAFDISVGPLINLWGFGPKNRDKAPTKGQVELALSQIGYQKLKLDSETQSIKKDESHLRIDLSAIAKGFGVDKISKFLTEQGLDDHLVEIGGELRMSGLNQSNKKWRIAVEQPDLNVSTTQNGLEITNRGVATSGDYRNYFVENGIRRSHIINPQTGFPITHKLASVTVLHESTMLADAYATAILVLGEIEGKIFVEENKLDVLMVIRNEDKFDFWSSSALFK